MADSDPADTLSTSRARRLDGLLHPHLGRIVNVVHENSEMRFVQEKVPGSTLASLIKPGRTMPMIFVMKVGIQIGSALAAAHSAGLVHGALRPENISLKEGPIQPFVKVMGFSTVKPADEIYQSEDQFALAQILYELATGASLKPTLGPDGVTFDRSPEPPSSLRPELADAFDFVLLTALQPDPKKRFESLEKFVAELEQVPLSPRMSSHDRRTIPE